MSVPRQCTLLVTLVLGLASFAMAEEVLLFDDFDKGGPLDTKTLWNSSNPERVPSCANSSVTVNPHAAQYGFFSKKEFDEPISVEFKDVRLDTVKIPDGNNNIGITPGFDHNMICFRFANDSLNIVRKHAGGYPSGGDKRWGKVELQAGTAGSVKYDLRIDWWPGDMVRYFINGEQVGEFANAVRGVAGPVGVRVERVKFSIGSIKVTRLKTSAKEILAERKAREEARRLARVKKLRELSETRAKAIAKQFPKKLRMVIKSPCNSFGIDPIIQHELQLAGMEVLSFPNAPSSGKHSLYNIVVFGDPAYHLVQPDPNTGELPDRIKGAVAPLRKFLAAGGGIWFCGLGEQNWGKSSYALNYILKGLGLDAEVVGEVVMDTAVMKQGRRGGDYAWAEVLDDPLTTGVNNLLHPIGAITGEGSMGMVPIVRAGPEWRVLVKGSPTAASFPCNPTDATGSLLPNPRTVKSSPMLCAVRQAGKGRVVLWPTWSNWTVTGGSGGKLVDGERDGKTSDGARLIENLLCWLAEPSQGSTEVGTFDSTGDKAVIKVEDVEQLLEDWQKPGRRHYRNQYKGIIGAHSNLSDGNASPEQMIAAAKKAGYDFIAFTESLEHMDETKWKKLLAVCDRFSSGSFKACPGMDFFDEAGNRGVIFNNRFWIKPEWRSKENPKHIHWLHNLTYAADADAKRWPPIAIIRSQTNPKPPWIQGLWSFLGVYCYEGGKLVDDSFDQWRRVIGRHVFFMNTSLMAVHTVRSPEEIAASAQEGRYQTWVMGGNLSDAMYLLTGCVGHGPNGTFPTYISMSSGPRILDFRNFVPVMGGDVAFNLRHPDQDRGLLHILVESDVGLKEIAVYDKERLVRKYSPQGKKQFEKFMTFHPDECHVHTMTATDMKGRVAHSGLSFMQIYRKIHRRCGDNWNWMTTGKGPGSFKPVTLNYGLHETTHGWTPRSVEPKKPSRRRYGCEQARYGHGGLSAATNWYINGNGLLVDGKIWNTGYPAGAIAMNFHTVGRYGILVTNNIRQDLVIPKLEGYTIGAFSGPYKVVTSPWPADLKQVVPLNKPDGAVVNRYQGKVTFTKNVAAQNGNTVPIRVGVTGNPGAGMLEVMNADGTFERHVLRDQAITGEIPDHGYIAWYDDEGDGIGGIISLKPGVRFSYTRDYQSCFVHVPSPVKPGTVAEWDVIFVQGAAATTWTYASSNYDNDLERKVVNTSGTNEEMLDVWQGMGIAGKPTLYEVQPQVGEVLDYEYLLTLKAEDSGFSGKISRTTKKTLPIHLPVIVKGLNTRWDAVIWYRGKSNLLYSRKYRDPWTGAESWISIIAEYKERTNEVRYMPVLEGGEGYCQIETDKQDAEVFIGNPIVCDQPEVFICVIKAEKGKCTFEINNPTNKALTVTVRPSAGFDLTGRWTRNLTLPPGGFKVVKVGR